MADEGTSKKTVAPFDYADYERQCRDRRWNRDLLAPYVEHFRGCRQVLDLACGPGLFLELLAENGIAATGVERNPEAVRLVREQGGSVVEADVFAFLAESPAAYDGVFCSHFIEHLPFEKVLSLIESIAHRLEPGGTFVLVFPNPESIRMQLFGFWRDPEHVRFYHPELIEAVCKHYGFSVVAFNWREAPFAVPPPQAPSPPSPSVVIEPVPQEPATGLRQLGGRLYRKLLRALRLASRGEVTALEAYIHQGRVTLPQEFLDWAARADFALNRMWAWHDNALIVCRKPQAEREDLAS
ncbi:MAG: class I SAM-dependent methyltransferase [Deltaproteobacteria bacterium]|nr:class I SAM-dependent methyltransferase [Deltaproteobacteria bacterium]